jgi:hypothetical protein
MRVIASLILALSLAGCEGAAREDRAEPAPPLADGPPPGSSKIRVLRTVPDAPLKPGDIVRCEGELTIERMFKSDHGPIVSLMKGRVTINQFWSSEMGERLPGGPRNFAAEVKLPKEPGSYALRASMVIRPEGGDGEASASKGRPINSVPFKIEVK